MHGGGYVRRAIFIGYRRADTGDMVGRVYDALSYAFGENQVFRDVDNIPIGAEFAKHIRRLLPKCRVFLAFIGPDWLTARTAGGLRRIDDPDDLVRVEIETALATPRLLVVPVLVSGARMPAEHDLPESLRPLAQRHAAIMRSDPDFRNDTARLVEALREHLRTGRLNLQALGGAAHVAVNSARFSASTLVAWLALAGATGIATAVPEVRGSLFEAGSEIVDIAREGMQPRERIAAAPPTVDNSPPAPSPQMFTVDPQPVALPENPPQEPLETERVRAADTQAVESEHVRVANAQPLEAERPPASAPPRIEPERRPTNASVAGTSWVGSYRAEACGTVRDLLDGRQVPCTDHDFEQCWLFYANGRARSYNGQMWANRQWRDEGNSIFTWTSLGEEYGLRLTRRDGFLFFEPDNRTTVRLTQGTCSETP